MRIKSIRATLSLFSFISPSVASEIIVSLAKPGEAVGKHPYHIGMGCQARPILSQEAIKRLIYWNILWPHMYCVAIDRLVIVFSHSKDTRSDGNRCRVHVKECDHYGFARIRGEVPVELPAAESQSTRLVQRMARRHQDGGDAHLAARMGVRTRTSPAHAPRITPHI